MTEASTTSSSDFQNFSNENVTQIDSTRNKCQSNDCYSGCINDRDNFWSIAGKHFSPSEKGALFFEKIMKKCEMKTAEFLESQHEKPAENLSQIEDMLLAKPNEHINKHAESFFKSRTLSKK